MVVRGGSDVKLDPGKHLFFPVHLEMLYQILRDYHGIQDYHILKASDIRFLYNGLRGELKEHTKPKGSK